MNIDNGGPAFPAPDLGEQDFGQRGIYSGMTLRDYLAAHAPPPPADFMRLETEYSDSLAYTVRWRWAYADAMLKARAAKAAEGGGVMGDKKKPDPFICPNKPKGKRCPVCGSSYICMRWREKQPQPKQPQPKQPDTPPHQGDTRHE